MANPRLALGWLIAGEARQHPGRIAIAVIAIAIGVALGFAVHLVNGSALVAFGEAVRTVNGAADLQVKAASPLGFSEAVYPRVMAVEGVVDASPVVSLNASAGRGGSFALLGIDIVRAASVTPSLIGTRAVGPGGGNDDPFADNALFVSRAQLAAMGAAVGKRVTITANGRAMPMIVQGLLPGIEEGRRVGVIDIAAAQWRFSKLGRIDRIDLSLAPSANAEAVRARLAALLPPAAIVSDDQDQVRQGDALSRAYRVNLDMLALVALLTGTFLVYSTASLSVARRLQSFALLRTLGLQRKGIVTLVAVEGAMTGIIGAALGLAIGYALAAGAIGLLGGDLGGGYFGDVPPALLFAPGAALVFFLLGILAAIGGSLAPALQAARAAPAVALKNAGDAIDPRSTPDGRLPLVLLVAGALTALLPAVGRLPLFGYASIALLLAAGIAAMPWLAQTLLGPFAKSATGKPAIDLAVQHLHGAPSAAATALCGIVASTALMIAMVVMVTSFRGAVDQWLGTILAGDLYVRTDPGVGGFDAATQTRLATLPGIASIAFSRQVPVVLAADRPPMLLIARPTGNGAPPIDLIGLAAIAPPGAVPIWLSEPAARLLERKPGDRLRLPIGDDVRFVIVGIWRDYARQQGAMIIDSADYTRLTGDAARDEAGVVLSPGAATAQVARAIVAAVPQVLKGRVQTAEPAMLRRFALRLFDRSFAITYLLEAVAIIVGLAGVAATASAQATARTREFGMLRHIGVSRRQIIAMLGAEGALLGLVGGVAGVALGTGISQVLIHVVNPQSFNWTMITIFPVALMVAVIAALVVASALTAMIAGRRAASADAVRAVRADW